MLFAMSEDKKDGDIPATVVIAETQASAKPRSTKKYVVVAVSFVAAAAIILTAILVGMYLFTEAQKEILKFTLKFDKNSKQEVTSDPNSNIVQFHVSNPGREVWIVNDFNKDIQVVKIKTERDTNCYLNALNRTAALDPTEMTKPNSTDFKGTGGLTYMKSNTPISDTSFLSKTASDLCKGISVYWVYPHCASDLPQAPPNGTGVSPRNKRTYADYAPYYTYYDTYYNGYQIWCVEGCCRTICACEIDYYWYYDGLDLYCTWYYYNCPPYIYTEKIYDWCSDGPSGLSCPNYSPASLPLC